MNSSEDLKNNLISQVEELEILQSMFCNPGELKIEDPITLLEIKSYIEDSNSILPSELDLTINLDIDLIKFQLCINIPHEYPNILPAIFVRNSQLNREQNGKLNRDLKEFLSTLEKGEPCIFSAISWAQDNAKSYMDYSKTEMNSSVPTNKSEPPIRLWIYSHHIYSKTKRKEILAQAQALGINGFCMPGKPGIICIEGETDKCDEWWQYIKSMPWKRIFCKVTEEYNGEQNFCKFTEFEEVSFQTNNMRCNHMDIGELGKYLDDHGCLYIFKDLFGVDAKSKST